ncbi:MAG: AzlC family ABC transporter permease [Cyanobacteria bacterium SBLK]|nr:AzlC family ABC transporter permease [Cyanobacteria bacterium SBLK]
MHHRDAEKTREDDAIAKHRSPLQEFIAGARGIFPLVVGAIPFGIIFGTLAKNSGLSFWGAMGLSTFVFAGSSQFIALGLLASQTSLSLIIFTTFVVNLRHLLYAVSLIPHIKYLSQYWKIPIGFWLTDEAFAVAINRYNQSDRSPYKHWYYMGAAVFMYGNWQLSTFLGLTIGELIPNAANWGLDFAMSVTFIGMIIPYISSSSKNSPKTYSMLATILVSGCVSLLSYSLPHKLGLMIAAFAGIISGMYVDRLQKINR